MANPPYSFSSENPVTTLTLGPKAPYIQQRVILSNETSTATWFMNDNKSQIASPHWFGISVNNFLWALQDNLTVAETINAWFTTLENGKDGQPLTDLLGQQNQDSLFKASSRLYARYAVQAISANMRSSAPQPGRVLPTYNATFSSPVLRLKQNNAPKIVLQVLLGVMVLCGVTAYLMVDTKDVLRRSPYSIVGKMELLAHSELCNSDRVIPPGAEWWHEKRRAKEGLFQGWFFGMGFWGEAGNRWYGIDVGKAEKSS